MAGSYQSSYNPSGFGWTPNHDIVGFTYGEAGFIQGVTRAVVPLFEGLLHDLIADGLDLPTGPSTVTGNWGYTYRDVRGSTNLSFHAYGLAIDIDAPHNGMTYDTSFRGTQPPNAAAIARKWGCQWGGEWSGRRDVMHYEVHCSPSEVAGIVAANGGSTPPPDIKEWYEMPLDDGAKREIAELIQANNDNQAVATREAIIAALNNRSGKDRSMGLFWSGMPKQEVSLPAVPSADDNAKATVDLITGPAGKKFRDSQSANAISTLGTNAAAGKLTRISAWIVSLVKQAGAPE